MARIPYRSTQCPQCGYGTLVSKNGVEECTRVVECGYTGTYEENESEKDSTETKVA